MHSSSWVSKMRWWLHRDAWSTNCHIFVSFFPAMTVSLNMPSCNFCGLNSTINLWNLGFSQWWRCWWYSGLWCHVNSLIDTNISEKNSLSIFKAGLKMETLWFSTMLVSICDFTQQDNVEHQESRLNSGNACHHLGQSLLSFRLLSRNVKFDIVTYSGSIHDGTLLHSKSQYTTVKHSQQLFKHMYTSNPHGLGTLTPIEFFQQDLLWQSSNTHSHSYSHKGSKHTSSIRHRAIGPRAHHNGTSAHSPSLTCHLPAPTIECLHRPPYKLTCSSRPTHMHICTRTTLKPRLHSSKSQHTLLITISSAPNNVQPLLVLSPHWQVHSKFLLYHHAITIETSLFQLLRY
jgi:hypothetical protein